MKIESTGTATYCPEDDKLRLYVGRVPRPEYDFLRSQGWTATPKQDCDFVATWSPDREETALAYSEGVLDDEDQSPADRAADRAERFGGYLDNRRDEAGAQAERYESGPQLHGHQSAALAERRANRHDRIATRACNSWEKAEYWQRRTAGVIGHALYVSTPAVRMGRIKTLEAELRKAEKYADEYAAEYKRWQMVRDEPDANKADKMAEIIAGQSSGLRNYKHPRPETVKNSHIRENGSCLWTLLTMIDHEYGTDDITGHEAAALWFERKREPGHPDSRATKWRNHYGLRLAYENQMLEAQGGRAAFVEMEAGGWIGKHQVQKVNKSSATGRVVSVNILAPTHADYDRKGKAYGDDNPRPLTMHTLNIERLKSDVYRSPTDEEREEFKAAKDAKPKGPPTINPTMEDAKRLQAQINAAAYEASKHSNYPTKPSEIETMTQAHYSGMYADYKSIRNFDDLAKIRVHAGGWQYAGSVIVLTDKPQKPIPTGVFKAPQVIKQQELKIA